MTRKELEQQLFAIREEAEKKTSMAIWKFVNERNPVKVGDVVTSRFGFKIKVDRITLGRRNDLQGTPCAVYSGYQIKRNGLLGCMRYMSRDDLETVNGKQIINHGYEEED